MPGYSSGARPCGVSGSNVPFDRQDFSVFQTANKGLAENTGRAIDDPLSFFDLRDEQTAAVPDDGQWIFLAPAPRIVFDLKARGDGSWRRRHGKILSHCGVTPGQVPSREP